MFYRYSILIIFIIGLFIDFGFESDLLTYAVKLTLLIILIYLEFFNSHLESTAAREAGSDQKITEPVIPASEKDPVDFSRVQTHRFNLLDLIRSQTELLRTISLSAYSFVFFRDSGDQLYSIEIFPKSLSLQMVRSCSELPVITVIDQNDGWIFENALHKNNNLLMALKTDIQFQSIIGFRLNLEEDKAFYYLLAAPTPNFFNPDDQTMIADINKIVLSAISGRIEANTQAAQNLFLSRLNILYQGYMEIPHSAFNDILNMFAAFLSQYSQATNISIAVPLSRSEDTDEGRITHRIGFDDGYDPDDIFPLKEGLAGLALLKNQPYLMDDIEKGELFIPRFSSNEKSNKGIRTFLAIPFGTSDAALGVICIQHNEPDFYNPAQKDELLSWINTLNLMLNKNSSLKEEL